MTKKTESTALVPMSKLPKAVKELRTKKRLPMIPQPMTQPDLNDINQLAYAIIKEGLYDLSAKDLSFLGSMAKTSGDISKAQRKYLKDLCIRHLGYDFDEELL